MTTWTRRNACLMVAAVMLLPTALAGERKAKPPKGALGSLDFHLELLESDPHRIIYQVSINNRGNKALSIGYDVLDAELFDGNEHHEAIVWANENHPFSRKIHEPRLFLLPPGRTREAGRIYLMLEEKKRSPTVSLHALLTVFKGRKFRTLSLPPLPVQNGTARSELP